MRVLNFDQFISEMNLSGNYKEMTKVYDVDNKRSESKSIVVSKDISPEGWGEMVLLNSEGEVVTRQDKQKFSTGEILKGFAFGNEDVSKNAIKIISKAINLLATSDKIENYKPSKKSKYYLVDFGKIELWNGRFELYPIFVPNNANMRKYEGGHFYGVAEESLLEPNLMTFFYSSDPDKISEKFLLHKSLYHLNKTKPSKVDENEFIENVSIVSPYGEDFILRIDMSLDSPLKIENSIKQQLGYPKLEEMPKKKGDSIDLSDGMGKDSSLSLSPGKKIKIIVPFISKEEFTEIEIKEIINMKEIQNAKNFQKGLRDINYIEISWESKKGIVKSKLQRGTKIQWKKKGEWITGKITEEKSMIIPNEEVIEAGKVPVKVSR